MRLSGLKLAGMIMVFKGRSVLQNHVFDVLVLKQWCGFGAFFGPMPCYSSRNYTNLLTFSGALWH